MDLLVVIDIAKICLTVSNSLATFVSVVFMMSPSRFAQLEEFLTLQFGGEVRIVSIIEGEVNFLNDWIKRNRIFFGPLFSVLAALNTRNAFFL